MSDQWPDHFPADVVRQAFGSRLSGYVISLEAWRRGLTVTFLDGGLRMCEVSDGKRRVRFDKSRPSLTSAEASSLVEDKIRTSERLREHGVPVPDSRLIRPSDADSETDLLRSAEELGYPLVLKPLRGSMGRDVFTGLRDETELLGVYRDMVRRSGGREQIVLETHVEGDDYRVLVIGGKASAVCLRRPANVVGDGVNSISQLIQKKNEIRLENPYLKPIAVDREVQLYLERAGYTTESIPEPGERVRLRGKANASQGGDTIDVTGDVPQAVKDAAVGAVQAIPGLTLAGVDVLFDDRSAANGRKFSVIELNARPEIELNMYPSEGAGQDIPKDLISEFFPEAKRRDESEMRSVALDLDQLLAPLKSAAAEQVKVRARPKHSYPFRVSYSLSREFPLDHREEAAILYASRRDGVSGCIRAVEGKPVLVVYGLQDRVETFIRNTSDLLQPDHESCSSWRGVVYPGFSIAPFVAP